MTDTSGKILATSNDDVVTRQTDDRYNFELRMPPVLQMATRGAEQEGEELEALAVRLMSSAKLSIDGASARTAGEETRTSAMVMLQGASLGSDGDVGACSYSTAIVDGVQARDSGTGGYVPASPPAGHLPRPPESWMARGTPRSEEASRRRGNRGSASTRAQDYELASPSRCLRYACVGMRWAVGGR